MYELSEEDHQAIGALFTAYGDAWGRADARACAELFTEDGDGFAIDGQVLTGTDAIRRYYEEQLTGKYRDFGMSDFHLDPPRPIGRNVALMNGSWMLHGFRAPEGEPSPVQVRGTFIMRKDEGRWRYVAVRFMVPFAGEP